ncbi:MAG TPA: SRPBCC family protein [Cellulomonas sp.]
MARLPRPSDLLPRPNELLPPPPPKPPRRTVVAAVAFAAGASLPVMRAWMLAFGSTEDELDAALPGDALLTKPNLVATRTVGIAAPAAAVWPWLVQLGQGRGGFYSYDELENLVGCDIHSADRIVPEWQDLAAGDQVHLAPPVALDVVVVEQDRALVLQGAAGFGPGAPPYDFTWAFVLRPGRDGGTRLVVRERYQYKAGWARLLVEPVSVLSWVMSQKMLRGIRDRAQAAYRPGSPAAQG